MPQVTLVACGDSASMQVLTCLHGALQAVDLRDPLLRVSVGLRLALHFEAANDPASAATVLKKVSSVDIYLCRLHPVHPYPLPSPNATLLGSADGC